jgi:hypothetical protein
MNNITIVTGFWNLNSDKKKFKQLLKCNNNICIYTDPQNEKFIWKHRNERNTKIFHKTINDFKTWFEFFQQIKEINKIENCEHSSVELSKIFLLHDIKIHNPFNTAYFFWIDPDITKIIDKKSLINGNLFNNLPSYVESINKFVVLSKGNFFGGNIDMISKINAIYYDYLRMIINNKFVESIENILANISQKYPNIIHQTDNDDFFEILSNHYPTNVYNTLYIGNAITHLYVLTYNSPDQFEYLINSFIKSDVNFLNKPKKFLLNNSTDETTNDKYNDLCKEHGFEQIKKNNIGICGGRQFIAEHFARSDANYYIFFEDDMLLNEKNSDHCQNGFRKWTSDLYNKTLNIIHKEKYDFLKLNFTEVYGGNEIQWAWYNVPDVVRHKYFPNKLNKPEFGLDPDPPATQFGIMHRYEDITYLEGDIYYCNWPLWFSKEGNKKVFLEPEFAYPYEQTWMSLVFQKQKEKLFKVAVLLLSPIGHDRLKYYEASERREN